MDSLGDRMKAYERSFDMSLPLRMPVIIRLDGMAFHTLTKKMERPFDHAFMAKMARTALHLCNITPTAALSYVQSDEISLLLVYYKKLESEPFFGNRVNKLLSFTAGQAAAFFNERSEIFTGVFDARAFVLPREDVENYFIWRWKDWVRNSLSMLAQAHFSHKQLHKKNQKDMHDMLHEKGVNWAKLSDEEKNGIMCLKRGKEEEKKVWKPLSAPVTMDEWREIVRPLVNPEEE
jgi:tRNA(His) 5'-end guanylyltransferase